MTEQRPESPTANPATATSTVELDADVATVLDALTRPELLAAWLGRWTDDGDGTGTVVTDDGTVRTVERIATGVDHEVAWRWSPADATGPASTVRFTVTRSGERTRLTVVEVPALDAAAGVVASASATATAVPWLGCLLALGAVLAAGAPALV